MVDYSSYRRDKRWRTREALLLWGFEQQKLARAWDLRLQYRSGRKDEDAKNALEHAVRAEVPWLHDGTEGDLGSDSDTIYTEVILDWYRQFAPEALQAVMDEIEQRHKEQ